jgi:polar amino acid transport system substrate-binding protein
VVVPDRRVLAAVLNLLLPTALLAADCNRTLQVAATGLWGRQNAGEIELRLDQQWLEAIAADAGFCINTEHRETVIARRLAMLETGEVDVLVGASRTPEREQYARFSLPYRSETVLLYVRSDRLAQYQQLRSFTDLLALPVHWLAMRDSWLGPQFAAERARLLGDKQVSEFEAYPQGVTMLRYGRGELLLAPDTFGEYLKREQISDIVALASAMHSEPVHFMFSKISVSETELNRFNRALKRVQQRGGPTPN